MKPETLQDLLVGGHITNRDVERIARNIFDGHTTSAFDTDNEDSLGGYIVTACALDELPEHVRGFVLKAIRAFKVENILDYATGEDEDAVLRLEDDGG